MNNVFGKKRMPNINLKDNNFAVHFNSNLVCCIDVETTGLDHHLHDIWQICILPLNSKFEPNKNYMPFEMLICPRKLENYDRTNKYLDHKGIQKALIEGLDAFAAEALFEKWYISLGIAENKKITPLGQNYSFDKGFLQSWLGMAHYEYYFDYHYRDAMSVALWLNDRADYVNAPEYPHPQVALIKLCENLGIRNYNPHDALSDAVATAAVYKELIKRGSI